MVIVKLEDKRYHSGYNIIFFKTDVITDEIIQFVKNHPKAYWIENGTEFYHSRQDFFKMYG